MKKILLLIASLFSASVSQGVPVTYVQTGSTATLSSLTVSSNTILSGATFYQAGPQMLAGPVEIGVSTYAPTHALTFSSSSVNGLSLYNTADQATNYERFVAQWSGNIFTMKTGIGGTGVARNLSMGTNARLLLFDEGGVGGSFYLFNNGTAGQNSIVSITTIRTNAAGANVELRINPTEVGSGTAGYTGILVNPTETSTGSGPKRLIDLQTGGVDKFLVDNRGLTQITPSTMSVNSLSVSTAAAGPYHLLVSTQGHISTEGSSPTISGCGTSPTVNANCNDNACTITPGAAAAGCTITFAKPWTNTPVCIVAEETFSLTNAPSYTVSATAIVLTETALTSVIDYICAGKD